MSEILWLGRFAAETVAIAQDYINRHEKSVRFPRLPGNRGKGAAAQIGVMNAVGRFIIKADADNATPIEEVSQFVAEPGEDEILIGSTHVKSANREKKQSK